MFAPAARSPSSAQNTGSGFPGRTPPCSMRTDPPPARRQPSARARVHQMSHRFAPSREPRPRQVRDLPSVLTHAPQKLDCRTRVPRRPRVEDDFIRQRKQRIERAIQKRARPAAPQHHRQIGGDQGHQQPRDFIGLLRIRRNLDPFRANLLLSAERHPAFREHATAQFAVFARSQHDGAAGMPMHQHPRWFCVPAVRIRLRRPARRPRSASWSTPAAPRRRSLVLAPAAPIGRANPAGFFQDRSTASPIEAFNCSSMMAMPRQHLVGRRRAPRARIVIRKFELAIGPVFENRRRPPASWPPPCPGACKAWHRRSARLPAASHKP